MLAVAHPRPEKGFPIVCLGGSAGVLEAYIDIVARMSDDTGMAFIIAQHRSPSQPELLTQILGRVTVMKVIDIEQGMRLRPDCVFLIPPRMELQIRDDICILRLAPLTNRWPKTINALLYSMAETIGLRTIAVILSGMDSDGSAALKAVKAAGGKTYAQRGARFDSMPINAVRTGYVDQFLTAREIGNSLNRLK